MPAKGSFSSVLLKWIALPRLEFMFMKLAPLIGMWLAVSVAAR
jgi:hypothetical protein